MEKTIDKTSSVPTHCPIHSQTVEYVCVDPVCSADPHCCMYCIKELHGGCDDNFIVENERLGQAFDIKLSTVNLDEEKQILIDAIKKQKDQFANQSRAIEATFDSLAAGELENIAQNGRTIQLLKKFYTVAYDPNTGGYNAKCHFDVPEDEQTLMAKNFEKDIECFYKTFIKSVQETPLEFHSSLKISGFNLHKNIQVQKKGNSLFFSRIKGNNDFNYFSAIYQTPLKSTFKLEIRIESINSGDPYLDVGIMGEKKFKTMGKDPIVSFAGETFSYCGTSQSGMEGSYGSAKFKPGFIFYIEINMASQTFSITSQDKVVKLYKKNLSKTEHFYFFLTLYHPEAACFVRVLR